jgi:hypothetical protein
MRIISRGRIDAQQKIDTCLDSLVISGVRLTCGTFDNARATLTAPSTGFMIIGRAEKIRALMPLR